MKTFKNFFENQEKADVYDDLAKFMVKEGVDVQQFRHGLDLVLNEWQYNPFKTAANMGASGAGAVLGSALGPVGTALGGVAGGLVGKAGNYLAGKAMGKATASPILPAYEKVAAAVAELNAAMGKVATPAAADLKKKVAGLQNALTQAKTSFNNVNKAENERLDAELKSGGGWAGKLQGMQGDGKMAGMARWLGGALEKIPVMKQDAGLRRAMAKGMDAINAWAKENPKKAAMLNAAAGAGGAVLGGMAGGALGGGPSAPQQQQGQVPQNAIPNKSGSPEVDGADWTTTRGDMSQAEIDNYSGATAAAASGKAPYLNAAAPNGPSPVVKGFPSGKVDNSALLGGEPQPNWQNQSFNVSPDGKSMSQTKSGVFGPGDVHPQTPNRAGEFFRRLIKNKAGKVVGSEERGSGRTTGFLPD
jgi:hypothetical protein